MEGKLSERSSGMRTINILKILLLHDGCLIHWHKVAVVIDTFSDAVQPLVPLCPISFCVFGCVDVRARLCVCVLGDNDKLRLHHQAAVYLFQ